MSKAILVTIEGETKNLTQWAAVYGIDVQVVYARLRIMKWDLIKAITKPVRPRAGNKTTRSIALFEGAKYYEGGPHYKCGNTTRYTRNGSCIVCT